MTKSIVFIRVPQYDYEYRFAGVTQITHSLTTKTATDTDSESNADYVNGARNQPNKVTLNVIESDVGHPAGWAVRMMQAMEAVKRNRILCNVSTPAFVYAGMLLSEFTATVDETTPSGWTGTLIFVQYVRPTGVTLNVYDNSSVIVHTGSTGAAQRVSGDVLTQLLQRAGIR